MSVAVGASADVLAPLALGYLGRGGAVPPEDDPAAVRAMPLVLRIERSGPPARTPLLEASARAALAVCLDPRSAPGGEWHDAVAAWIGGRIRKLARRARGAHWVAVAVLPGATACVGDGPEPAQVRALVPSLMAEVPREVARLRIGGTDMPADSPGPPPAGVPVIWLNPGVELTVGKAAAQVGHASMLFAALHGLDEVPPFAVRVAPPARWRALLRDGDAVAVRDAGLTEVAPGTVTCVATP